MRGMPSRSVPKKTPPGDYAFMAGPGKGLCRSAPPIPAPRLQHDRTTESMTGYRKHDRHSDKDADDRGEGGARLEAEQRNRCGDRELEEIRGADQGRGTSDVVRY